MTAERNTSFILKVGVLIGIAAVVTGLIADIAGHAHADVIIAAGIAVIVFTQFAGLLASFASLAAGREKKYAAFTLVLITVMIIGMAVALYLR